MPDLKYIRPSALGFEVFYGRRLVSRNRVLISKDMWIQLGVLPTKKQKSVRVVIPQIKMDELLHADSKGRLTLGKDAISELQELYAFPLEDSLFFFRAEYDKLSLEFIKPHDYLRNMTDEDRHRLLNLPEEYQTTDE